MKRAAICLLASLLCLPALAQQSHINRIDVFTGYSYLNTPVLSLPQHGFNGSFGINMRRWLAMGVDYSIWNGSTQLTVDETKVASTLKPLVPASLMSYGVATNAHTWTLAMGPQINIRKWDRLTVFVRPGLGIMHEKIDIKYAGTPFATLLPQLGAAAPSVAAKLAATQVDQVPFYGAGGGVDISASRNLGLRVSVDFVHSSMFSSILPSQNTVRISIGPQWKFGEMKQGRK